MDSACSTANDVPHQGFCRQEQSASGSEHPKHYDFQKEKDTMKRGSTRARHLSAGSQLQRAIFSMPAGGIRPLSTRY
jgi:hypothetical protein